MTIEEIYNHYKIIPSLRVHMQRVATVGATLCDHWTGPSVNQDRIVNVLLIHDLGNILKFDFSLYPEFFEPEGAEYWKEVREWITQFGATETDATMEMAKRVVDDAEVINLLEELVMYPLNHSIESDNWELKICDFADMCVTPFKICHWSERIDQAVERVTKGKCPKDAARKIQIWREQMTVLDEQVMRRVAVGIEKIVEEANKSVG